MNKGHRHIRIRDIISKYEIETQDQLVQSLKDSGVDVTQATVSRDIKLLKLVKMQSESGKYKYIYLTLHTPNSLHTAPNTQTMLPSLLLFRS